MEALRDIGDADLRSFDLAVPYGGYIMDAFARFCNSLSTSEVRLSYREADMAEVISRVTEERSDIGLIRCRSANLNQVEHYLMQKELAFEPVWEYACVLLMARSHPLASFGAITEDSLAECVELCRKQAEFGMQIKRYSERKQECGFMAVRIQRHSFVGLKKRICSCRRHWQALMKGRR